MLGDEVRARNAIAIQKNNQFALGSGNSHIARRRCPKPIIGLPQVSNGYVGITGHLADGLSGGGARPIIRDQNFKWRLALGQQAAQHQAQRLWSVVGGDNHGDFHFGVAAVDSFKYISLR